MPQDSSNRGGDLLAQWLADFSPGLRNQEFERLREGFILKPLAGGVRTYFPFGLLSRDRGNYNFFGPGDIATFTNPNGGGPGGGGNGSFGVGPSTGVASGGTVSVSGGTVSLSGGTVSVSGGTVSVSGGTTSASGGSTSVVNTSELPPAASDNPSNGDCGSVAAESCRSAYGLAIGFTAADDFQCQGGGAVAACAATLSGSALCGCYFRCAALPAGCSCNGMTWPTCGASTGIIVCCYANGTIDSEVNTCWACE